MQCACKLTNNNNIFPGNNNLINHNGTIPTFALNNYETADISKAVKGHTTGKDTITPQGSVAFISEL